MLSLLNRTFFQMMITVFAAVTTYYLLATKALLSESLSITAGVVVAIICSLVLKKIFADRQQ